MTQGWQYIPQEDELDKKGLNSLKLSPFNI